MSFSVPNPDQNTSKPVTTQSVLNTVISATNINQIRGINPSGSTGSGIPKQVTGLNTSVSAATAGTTSAVTVTFHRDPSDVNFDAVVVYITGYQGNPSPVQIASASESPITFVLVNTGESVSLVVQAIGNGGSAPLNTSPTTGVKLPKSAGGGFGPTSSTASTFDQLGTGTNTKAVMTVGSGAKLQATGTGIINGTEINGVGITGTPSLGKIPIAQNSTSAVWADPVVQGVYADGASVASPGSAGNLSTIQPVLVAGKNASGNMASIPITTNGVKVDGSAVTQPISASALPLPTGASTSALQTTGNTSLSTLAGAVTSSVLQDNIKQVNGATVNIGAGNAGTGTMRVVLASDQTTVAVKPYIGSQIVSASAPSAGSDISVTVPAGAYRLKSFRFTLVASATAANRLPLFFITDASGNVFVEVAAMTAVPASTDGLYTAGPGIALSSVTFPSTPNNNIINAIPTPEVIVLGGYLIRTSTAGLQTGDQYGGIFYQLEQIT